MIVRYAFRQPWFCVLTGLTTLLMFGLLLAGLIFLVMGVVMSWQAR